MTHKLLKSCRSKMTTLEHDVCDVHAASSLYIYIYKLVGKVYIGFSLLGGWGSHPTNNKFAHSSPPHQIFIPSHRHRKSIQPNKK